MKPSSLLTAIGFATLSLAGPVSHLRDGRYGLEPNVEGGLKQPVPAEILDDNKPYTHVKRQTNPGMHPYNAVPRYGNGAAYGLGQMGAAPFGPMNHAPFGPMNHSPFMPMNQGSYGPMNQGPYAPINQGPYGLMNHGSFGPMQGMAASVCRPGTGVNGIPCQSIYPYYSGHASAFSGVPYRAQAAGYGAQAYPVITSPVIA